MGRLYHVSINSIYVEIVRIRYSCSEYIKAWVRYYSKASDTFLREERNVKILRKCFKFWEAWSGK